jgi:hypothetical protein
LAISCNSTLFFGNRKRSRDIRRRRNVGAEEEEEEDRVYEEV